MIDQSVEPWLRGTLFEIDAVRRQVLHSFEQTREDADRWCAQLTGEQIHARPYGLASVAFHLRHIARSLDRLLSYAEGRALDEQQRHLLASEMEPDATPDDVIGELRVMLESARQRVLALPKDYESPRYVGGQRLETTLGGLLVHLAEHTQRHIGQAIVTAKLAAGR